MAGVRKIQVGDLSIADKINLENLLQKLVEENAASGTCNYGAGYFVAFPGCPHASGK